MCLLDWGGGQCLLSLGQAERLREEQEAERHRQEAEAAISFGQGVACVSDWRMGGALGPCARRQVCDSAVQLWL